MEKFRNYVGLVLCLCIVTTVSTAQRKVETVAEKVMLFIDGAQVTRTKRVDIGWQFGFTVYRSFTLSRCPEYAGECEGKTDDHECESAI